MPDLSRDGDVFVLDLGADENRFAPALALLEEPGANRISVPGLTG